MAILEIHTDGACSGNQYEENLGGWGAVLKFGEHEKELFGSAKNTTNNRMEMTALLMGLKAVKKIGLTIHVFSDSAYLMDCFRKEWYKNWQKNGWKTSAKKSVENQDLWQELLPFLDIHNISFFRVRGHLDLEKAKNSSNLLEEFNRWNNYLGKDVFLHAVIMNNRADALANKGIDTLR